MVLEISNVSPSPSSSSVFPDVVTSDTKQLWQSKVLENLASLGGYAHKLTGSILTLDFAGAFAAGSIYAGAKENNSQLNRFRRLVDSYHHLDIRITSFVNQMSVIFTEKGIHIPCGFTKLLTSLDNLLKFTAGILQNIDVLSPLEKVKHLVSVFSQSAYIEWYLTELQVLIVEVHSHVHEVELDLIEIIMKSSFSDLLFHQREAPCPRSISSGNFDYANPKQQYDKMQSAVAPARKYFFRKRRKPTT